MQERERGGEGEGEKTSDERKEREKKNIGNRATKHSEGNKLTGRLVEVAKRGEVILPHQDVRVL